jgi:hypothetical protein
MLVAPTMPSSCRRCGAPLAPEATSWGRDGTGAAWSCTSCGAVRFEIGAQKPWSTEVVRERGGDAGGYRSAARAGEVVMVRRWLRPTHFFLFFGPLAALCLAAVALILGPAELIGLFVQVAYGFVLCSAIMMYIGLCGLVNSTRLELEAGVLRIKHGPLPLRKDVAWPSSDFTDVWTQHVRVSGAPDIYRLRVQLKSGGELVLLDELPSLEDGVFLEEKIMSKVGLDDRA